MDRKMSMEKRNEQLEVLEDVHEMLSDALKIAANEPSVGLYYVQQHVHKAAPFLLRLKNQIDESMVGADIATQDMNDSLSCILTMKDCGPPVIERVLKTLRTASNQIPSNRQTRGSFSQLITKPARTIGLSKAPLRSSSFLGDWRKDSSTNKVWEKFEEERSLADLRNKKDPGEKPSLPFPHSTRAHPSQKENTDLDRQELSNAAGCDMSDASESNDPASNDSKGESTRDANLSILSRFGSAIQKAGTVSRESVKLLAKDAESQVVGDGRVKELKKWISGQDRSRLGKKTDSRTKDPEGQVQSMVHRIDSEDLGSEKDTFEKFQAERQAKFEAWLNQTDDMKSSSIKDK